MITTTTLIALVATLSLVGNLLLLLRWRAELFTRLEREDDAGLALSTLMTQAVQESGLKPDDVVGLRFEIISPAPGIVACALDIRRSP